MSLLLVCGYAYSFGIATATELRAAHMSHGVASPVYAELLASGECENGSSVRRNAWSADSCTRRGCWIERRHRRPKILAQIARNSTSATGKGKGTREASAHVRR